MAFKRINTGDTDLARIQDAVAAGFSDVDARPLVGGNVLSATLIYGQDNLVAHGLGRMPQYWLVIRKDANAVVWEQPSGDLNGASTSDKLINLRCSATCNITLWVN